MMRWYWGYGGAGMWLYPLICVLLVVFVIAMIVRMVHYRHFYGGPYHRYNGPPPPHGNPGNTESALDILNRRYANGEISKEDFDRMKKDIQG